MKFNVWLTLSGPGGVAESPVQGTLLDFHPIEYANLSSLLHDLSTNLPKYLGITVVGVRIEQSGESNAKE